MNTKDLDHYLANNIRSLDLIGFRGNDFVSKLITHCQRKGIKDKNIHITPKISHVGIVVEGKHLLKFRHLISSQLADAVHSNVQYIFESTASGKLIDNTPDVLGRFFFGAQIRPLKDVVVNYSGRVYHSPKLFPVNNNQHRKLVRFVNNFNYRPYEKSVSTLFGSLFKCIPAKENTESVFCSELVSRALIKCHILHHHVNPEHVVPLDFYPDPSDPTRTLDVDEEIPLIFAPPISLK